MATSRAPLLFAIALLVGCARDVAAPTNTQTATATQASSTAAPKDAHASHDGQGPHAGCIYAGEPGAAGASACPGGGMVEPDAPKASSGHFGAAFTQTAAVPLGKAVADGRTDTVLISGTVEAVCQKKGCWMVVKDGPVTARVMMKDHAFAVPVDSRGKPVKVEGTIGKRTFDEAQVKHLEADKGGNPDAVAGARDEYVLMATGVLIQS